MHIYLCQKIKLIYRVSQKEVTDLIKASVKNRARMNRKSSLNYSLIVNLKIDTLFVNIRTLREDIFIMKIQISLHLETRAFRFWPKLQTRCFGESPQGQTLRRNSEQKPACLGTHLNGNVKTKNWQTYQ